MVKPGLVGMEVVLGSQLLQRRVIKGPHAFFGVNHRCCSQQQDDREKRNETKLTSKHGGSPGSESSHSQVRRRQQLNTLCFVLPLEQLSGRIVNCFRLNLRNLDEYLPIAISKRNPRALERS